MHKLFVVAGAAGFLAASAFGALAAEATGVLASIDAAGGTITLEDGQVFTLPEEFDPTTLAVGQQVTVLYEEVGEEMQASEVTPAQQ